MSDWIPVSERLPEDGVMVLVYESSFAKTDEYDEKFGSTKRERGVRFGSYIKSLSMMRPEGCNGGPYKITHWMPLPEPLQ